MNSRTLIVLIMTFFSMAALPAKLYAGDDIVDKISAALKSANASKISDYFYSSVNLEVGEIDGSYSKKQAEMIMSDFLKKEPVKSFEIKHQGSSDDGSKYIIGNYKTVDKVYRVYILLKKQNDIYLIHHLQFEND
ncbi:MAG: DUF4783 domain-containing protein [Bacteroidales bacterium]